MAIKIARVQTDDRLINQLQQNIASVVEPIFNNLTGNFTVSLTGCTTVPSGTATWQRSTNLGPVTISLPSVSGTSNATTCYIVGLPKELWPTSIQHVTVKTTDNTADAVFALGTINPQGVFQVFASPSSDAFTASGVKGIGQLCLTYITAI